MDTTSVPDRTHEERRALVSALMRPAAYPHEVETPVRRIETHISDLFLTGEFVYKVKKPVDLGFVDYSTLAMRRRFTELELDLNRRICPDVYVGVEPVTLSSGGEARIGGDGEPVEYALKMRQLPAGRSLNRLLRSGEIGPDAIRQIASLVARFHADADVVEPGAPLGGADALAAVVRDNLAVIARFRGVTCRADDFDDIDSYASAFLEARRDLLESRRDRGFARDCHGDLHAGNLFLDGDGIHVIDRVEFNDSFRFIDVASDLGFLVMDLEHAGRPDLAGVLVETYIAETGDDELRRLVDFYVVHRASVRCKVTSLLLDELDDATQTRRNAVIEEAASYAGLAARFVARQRPQAVYVMSGLMGSGKSTVARELARRWGLEVHSSDVVRKTLAGLDPDRVSDEAPRGELYAPEMSERTYDEVIRRGAATLLDGGSPVLDAAFIKRRHRDRAVEMAEEHGVPAYLVETRTPDDIALGRLGARYESGVSSSDGRPELLDWHRGESEAIHPDEAAGHVVIANADGPEEAGRAALGGLWRLILAEGN